MRVNVGVSNKNEEEEAEEGEESGEGALRHVINNWNMPWNSMHTLSDVGERVRT